MAFEYLKNVPLERAKNEYLELLVSQGFKWKTQRVSVQQACGRITAEAVYAHICAPHYAASAMIVGAVLVENVFALGGIGDVLLQGVKAADYPVVQGITLLLVAIFLLINLLVDIIYAAIDPRIRPQ